VTDLKDNSDDNLNSLIIKLKDELSNQQKMYDDSFYNSPIPMFVHVKGNIVKINHSAKNLLGIKDDNEILNKHISKLIHPDDIDKIIQRVKVVYETDVQPPAIEVKLQHVKGDEITAFGTGMKVKYNQEDAIQVFMSDITDLKKLSMQLENQKKDLIALNTFYQTLAECTNSVVYATEISALLQYICNILVDTGGYFMAWIGEAMYDKEKNVIPRAYAGNEDGYLKSISIRWDNSEFGNGPTGMAIKTKKIQINEISDKDEKFQPWIDQAEKRSYKKSIAIPIINNNLCWGSLNVYSDLKNTFNEEEVKLLEKIASNLGYGINSLIINEERNSTLNQLEIQEIEMLKLSSAIDQSPNLVLITDVKGKIEYVNKSFSDVTGYNKHEIIGANPRILKSGHTTAEEYKNFWISLKEGNNFKITFKNKKKDGGFYWARVVASPVFDKNGKITNLISIQQDITKEKEIEEQLIQSQKMDAVGKLAGGIAHDFNNILTGIIGYADLISIDPNNRKENQVFASEIKKAAIYAASLTKQLLQFSKKQLLTPRTLNLNESLKSIESLINQIIKEDIKVKILSNPALKNIQADPYRIEQLILNLLLNARDAVIENKGEIIISVDNVLLKASIHGIFNDINPGNYVLMSIIDDGKGIFDSDYKKLFKPFFTTKNEGTGLGLSIVKTIIDEVDAQITIQSKINSGTNISIYFKSDTTINPKRFESNELISGVERNIGILIVDDDVAVLDVFTKFLKLKNYKILATTNPFDALSIFKENTSKIDLVITDVLMPEMNGFQLIEKIRKINPDIRVLIVSGHLGNDQQIHEIENAIFLYKPITGSKLLEIVKNSFTK